MSNLAEKNNILPFPTGSPYRPPDQGEIVKADTNDGYTRLANEMLETLCQCELSARQYRVFMAVLRKTYGWNQKSDVISSGQIAELMNYQGGYRHICTDIRDLKERNILIGSGRNIGPNPHVNLWKLSKSKPSKSSANVSEIGYPKCPKTDTKSIQKRTHQPDELQDTCIRNQTPKVSENGHPMCPETDTKCVRNRIPQKTKDKLKTVKDIGKKKTRASPAPKNFQVTEKLIDWCRSNDIQADLHLETEQFLDHHRAKGSSFKCWEAAWRTWMRNTKKFTSPRQSQRPTQNNAMRQQDIQDWLNHDDTGNQSIAQQPSQMTQKDIDHEPF
ncbi:replication protein [Algicola sagamiensis]|uniref:replication protein n=1 Tax=Algicola sagamiensis TaxID=163869 RepID=UPI00035FF176|nr:replication protein [Algicola sagamiensis]